MITAQAKIDTARICDRAIEKLRVREMERLAAVPAKDKQKELSKTLGAAHVALKLLKEWLAGAGPNDIRSYLVTSVDSPLSVLRQRNSALDCLATVVLNLANSGYVHLIQSHSPAGNDLTYIMKRTGKGFAPEQAGLGRWGSSPSPAFAGRAPGIDADGRFTLPNRVTPIMGQPRPSMDMEELEDDREEAEAAGRVGG